MGGYLWSLLISLSVTIQTFHCRNIDVGDYRMIPQPPGWVMEYTDHAPYPLPEGEQSLSSESSLAAESRVWAVGLAFLLGSHLCASSACLPQDSTLGISFILQPHHSYVPANPAQTHHQDTASCHIPPTTHTQAHTPACAQHPPLSVSSFFRC